VVRTNEALSNKPYKSQCTDLDHDQGVGGLHGEEKVVVVVLPAHLGELEGRLHHAPRRVPVEGQDARGERAWGLLLVWCGFAWLVGVCKDGLRSFVQGQI
jgi:hypothetical protein